MRTAVLIATILTSYCWMFSQEMWWNPSFDMPIPDLKAYEESIIRIEDDEKGANKVNFKLELGTIRLVESDDFPGYYSLTCNGFAQPSSTKLPALPVRYEKVALPADAHDIDVKVVNYKVAKYRGGVICSREILPEGYIIKTSKEDVP